MAVKKKSLGHAEHSKQADAVTQKIVSRKLKVVFLGAGSAFFKNLFTDILSIPGAMEGEMAIVDIDQKRLKLAHDLAKLIIAKTNSKWKVTPADNARKVLKGADYVISCIEVSGTACVRFDNDIPLKYGVDQCIGDTIGAGGIFKALRTVPVWLEVLKDIGELCPNAIILNYTNPMSIMCLAATRANPWARHIGLCHSVQGTSHQLAGYANVPYEELKWKCGGVNHLAWFTELSHNGKSIYPLLQKSILKDKELLAKDPVRFDIMKNFGYFVTESSGHFSEYLPYYRKRKDLIAKHCGTGYLGQSSFYADNWPTWRQNNDQYRKDVISGKQPLELNRTWEYASHIIEAVEANKPFVAHLTVPNTGLISNLPQDGVVEVACLIDRNGVTPTSFGKLPSQLAAICDWHMRVYELAAQACIDKNREMAIHALMLDPHTASVCSPGEIRKMAEELFAAEKAFIHAGFYK